ncbi:DUF2335 domain-containing protein [Streptomyces olivaceus]|uniref:DUF2335 domain-containing protein n=1 Tax=Streptomyces olivaceus TaxID=47716 RepID=UPI0033A2E038
MQAEPLEPAAIRQITRVVRSEIKLSGPIPDPTTLRGYEAVQEGFAERIMAMAEREQSHRHSMDNLDVKQSYRLAARGQFFALLALSIMAALAITLALVGEPVWATVAGGVDVVAVVGVFITGQRRSTEEQAVPDQGGQDRDALPSGRPDRGDESSDPR